MFKRIVFTRWRWWWSSASGEVVKLVASVERRSAQTQQNANTGAGAGLSRGVAVSAGIARHERHIEAMEG